MPSSNFRAPRGRSMSCSIATPSLKWTQAWIIANGTSFKWAASLRRMRGHQPVGQRAWSAARGPCCRAVARSSATDDGKGDPLEQFLSAARKVNKLIDRGRELKLDPGSERRETERDLKGPHHCSAGGGISQSEKGPGPRDVSAAWRRRAQAVDT